MLLVALAAFGFSLSAEEQDELILTPSHLSDFITARQVRNLTVSGKKELAPVYGRYFRKPLIELLESQKPQVLQLRSMYFQSFDGMVIKGEARGIAKFADIVVYDCTFNEANQQAIHLIGPTSNEGWKESQENQAVGDQNVALD
jgi:hypothetical protein